ncbi:MULTISPECIES: carbohydrate ABC transporter permease [Bacillus]|uniref:ABC transporter permease n=2 Tax=Bacillus TaxID=1386 RepID=A0A0M3RAP4_9BACI|nr:MULTISPECIES: carbohydrate ABC transporter permease [Bacillus]ALC83556.1 ABC transporter permease [Bacillus gobiensis]MBP1082543.1 raffinose/stachyose/melibiose transport system permease protein [Bacillus capparidis]MED1097226.1 carbohydrate ABC transporter permease [Bacillus capparidis]
MKRNFIITILLAIGALFILFPLYLAVTVAFKTPEELAQSFVSLPNQLSLSNFSEAIRLTNFYNAFKNSAFITISVVILTLLTNSMVAYAIARNMHKRFYRYIYYFFISAMFIPFPILMLPIVKQAGSLGMDNPIGLIFLYVVYALSFNVFVYVGYIKSIPIALEEAAIIDGAGHWKIFWKVIFPLLTPINATVAILQCLSTWNDFLLPLVLLSDPNQATLPLTQFVFQGQFSTNYNLAFASYLMALLPMLVVYMFAQKWIISGVTRGSVK